MKTRESAKSHHKFVMLESDHKKVQEQLRQTIAELNDIKKSREVFKEEITKAKIKHEE